MNEEELKQRVFCYLIMEIIHHGSFVLPILVGDDNSQVMVIPCILKYNRK